MPDSVVIAHASTGGANVHSIVGVKFTTARSTAMRALRQLGLAGRAASPGREVHTTRPSPLPYGSADGADAQLRAACLAVGVELDDDVFRHLVDWYATEAAEVLSVSAAASRLQRVAPGAVVIEGELLYAVERSQAARLADVVCRRTRLGATGHPGRAALDRAADICGNILGWSTDERAAQVAEVETRWGTSGTSGT